ncbi:MAG: aminotransferase class I/II-fold pyridoxal phosphate-dependent enzyme, partial [Muribaculaceae bacterium]|nr:aminotransferase class I/II-fold pyridoxal phosphate-dependent enzyme [Muribaculaceae bacterium]
DNYKRVIIVVEAVYSMDGDTAPLKQLVALKKKYSNLLIYLDEAHSFGVFGEKGLGLAEREGLIEDVDFLIGTFGKATASAGAFVACPEEWKIYLLNSARSFIFSTALPPINYAWSLLMFRKLRTLSHERQVLAEKSLRFKKDIENITGKENPSCSQIIPYMVGDADKAIRLAGFLQDKGFDVLPIRRPTVPPGGERLRFSLSAATQESELKRLISTLLLYKNKL